MKKKKFTINCVVYQVLYRTLCEAVIEKYYKGKVKKFKSIEGSKLWDTFNQDDYNKLLGGDRGTSTLYFYSKKFDLDPERIEEDVIDPIAISKALQYIGIDISSSVDYKKTGRIRLAELLLDEFKKIFHDKIERVRDDYKGKSSRLLTHNIEVEYKPLNINIPDFDDEGTKELRIKLAKELFSTYFALINEKNIRYAWEMHRHTNRDEYWYDNFRKFSEAHKTLVIKGYEIQWISIHGPVLQAAVRIDYQTTRYSSRYLEKLKETSITNFRNLYLVMRHIVRQFIQQDVLTSPDSITLKTLMSEDPAFEIAKHRRLVTPEMVFGKPVEKAYKSGKETFMVTDYKNEISTTIARSKIFLCSCYFDGRRWLFTRLTDYDDNYMH